MSLQTYLTDSPTFGPLPPLDYSHVLTAFYQAAISTKLPVALWRYPGQADKQALVDLSGAAQPTKINFQHRGPGFAFAPFINEDGRSTLSSLFALNWLKTISLPPRGVINQITGGEFAQKNR